MNAFPNMLKYKSDCVGFINLGPSGTGFYAKAWPKSLKTIGQRGGPATDRKARPKKSNVLSLATSAHLSDRSARFGL